MLTFLWLSFPPVFSTFSSFLWRRTHHSLFSTNLKIRLDGRIKRLPHFAGASTLGGVLIVEYLSCDIPTHVEPHDLPTVDNISRIIIFYAYQTQRAIALCYWDFRVESWPLCGMKHDEHDEVCFSHATQTTLLIMSNFRCHTKTSLKTLHSLGSPVLRSPSVKVYVTQLRNVTRPAIPSKCVPETTCAPRVRSPRSAESLLPAASSWKAQSSGDLLSPRSLRLCRGSKSSSVHPLKISPHRNSEVHQRDRCHYW